MALLVSQMQSTSADCCQLLEPTDGDMLSTDISSPNKGQLKELRKDMQMIFQTLLVFKSRMTVAGSSQAYAPLSFVQGCSAAGGGSDGHGWLGAGLKTHPHELDGGRRQRIGMPGRWHWNQSLLSVMSLFPRRCVHSGPNPESHDGSSRRIRIDLHVYHS